MPSLAEHNGKDLMEGRANWNEVHVILDQFAHYPDMKFLKRHRQFLHHVEGIAYIRARFGEEAGQAAEDHVRMDCGHVPHAVDYYIGVVDNYGHKI